MIPWQAYIDDVVFHFGKYKSLAEKAFEQLGDEEFFKKPADESNSVAIIIKHVAGNLTSRFTDFLTTDGDKASRDRDAEFVVGSQDNRAALLASWERAWQTLFASLSGLKEGDALRKVTIRGEEHTVLQALQRALTHTSYHVGQITYLAKMLKTEGWRWITIPPGQSKQYGKPYLK